MELSCYNASWYAVGTTYGFIWGFMVSTATLTTCTIISESPFLNTYYVVVLISLGSCLLYKFFIKNRQVGMDETSKKKASARQSIG